MKSSIRTTWLKQGIQHALITMDAAVRYSFMNKHMMVVRTKWITFLP